MKKRITKAEIIKALRLEPLAYNNFFNPRITVSFSTPMAKVRKVDCTVCAVGAVLRRNLPKTATGYAIGRVGHNITKHEYFGGDPTKLLRAKNYWGALSCFFEAQAENDDEPGRKVSKKSRQACIEFVREHFPKSIMLEVDDELLG